MTTLRIASLVLLTLLSSCGGGGGGGASNQIGQFIDDPVSGLSYTCTGSDSSNSGVTNDKGEFNYSAGQICGFKVGNVALGQSISVPSDGKVTPQDVAGVPRSSTEIASVLVIAQFLQSLNDGSSAGKIVIPASISSSLSNAPSTVLVTTGYGTGTFISQSDLSQLLLTHTGKQLISPSVAKASLDLQISQGNINTGTGTLKIVQFWVAYGDSMSGGYSDIQNLASKLIKAIVSFSNNTTQIISSLVTWVVTSTSGDGAAVVTVDKDLNTALLTPSMTGEVSISALYGGLASENNLSIRITAAPPNVQDVTKSLDVLGTSVSTLSKSIVATDYQNLPLSFSISQNGTVGTASINASTGAYIYTVSGFTTALEDRFVISVSNGFKTSTSNVTVSLKIDPLIANQWHLQNNGVTAFSTTLPTAGNDMNVAGAWSAGYTGKGIKVAVVDTGLEVAHEDLIANVDKPNSRNFLDDSTDPTPSSVGFDHGTAVAGIIGAVAFNGKGGRGVAYNSTLRGYNFIAAASLTNLGNSLGMASYSQDNDIFNESFGSASTYLPTYSTAYEAIDSNVLTLRNGKGGVLVKSAGNDFYSWSSMSLASACASAISYGVSCSSPSTDVRNTSVGTIVVGAVNADGVKSSYSTAGSAIWVSAPGGEFGYNSSIYSGASGNALKPAIITTSKSGCGNYSSRVNSLDSLGDNAYASNCQYTATMNGTSSAAPNVSGVVALMLEANPSLSYRDVKHILAQTAKKTDPSNSGVISTTIISGTPVTLDQGWVQNSAGQWFSNWYGFGSVDAASAVTMAKSYTSYLPAVQTATKSLHYISTNTVPRPSVSGSTMTFSMSPVFNTVEQVVLKLNITSSPALLCNQIELTSPGGTKSIILPAANGLHSGGYYQTSLSNVIFLTNAFYGETSTGSWVLRFLDLCNSSTRTIISSSSYQYLTLYGR